MVAISVTRLKNWDYRAGHYTGEWKLMVFKNFRFQVVLRVIILTLTITILAWCVVYEFYLRSIYLAVGTLILVIEFIWYADRFNRDVKTFMIGLQQRDFTTRYQSSGKGKSHDELYEVLNSISDSFKKLSTEKEIQYRYLEMLVEHLRVSILSMDAEEKIHLANQAVKDLFQKEVLTSLKSLEPYGESLVTTLRGIKTGETKLVKLRISNELLQLSIHASEFKLDDRYYKLISMQNIRTELDAREMEAWQKLIRVLSHEIMNSVSPIISLSETLHGLVQGNRTLQVADHESLNKGLDAIRIRSEGLFNFTQSYRQLTGIPQLNLKQITGLSLMHRVQVLMHSKISEHGIHFQVSGIDQTIVVDPELMEHVLINLVLNAIEALKGKDNPFITLHSSKNAKGNFCIHVRDNGEGMDEVTAEKIFIPFFTTRKSGSGIGLALSKQILQLHNADIQLYTERGKGTEFVIVL
jgi:two-component system nitrogen regulation sensor histidine kinase NtrY